MIEHAWKRVKTEAHHEGAIRVDENHPSDFFAAQDSLGRPGLVVVLTAPPPTPPLLESVDVTVGQRADGRWSLGIWLGVSQLEAPFGQLCEDLIESSRGVPRTAIGKFVIGRLSRWQELLEAAGSGMSMSKLRGLIGELLLLRDAQAAFGVSEAIEGWVGPYSAPQDFALPGVWVEVKATIPTARTIRITSKDQLAAPGRLVLAVYSLASVLPGESGVSAGALVADIESVLRAEGSEHTAIEFGRRLNAVAFNRAAEYAQLSFRQDAVRYFEVQPGFPRLTPSDLITGIEDVAYEIDLGALAPFEITSPVKG